MDFLRLAASGNVREAYRKHASRDFRHHNPFFPSDAESLTAQVLGFRLPLAGLADWVRGAASASSPAKEEKDAEGRLTKLEQAGWQIEYQDYAGGRPSRMRLTYPGIELRLAISKWN